MILQATIRIGTWSICSTKRCISSNFASIRNNSLTVIHIGISNISGRMMALVDWATMPYPSTMSHLRLCMLNFIVINTFTRFHIINCLYHSLTCNLLPDKLVCHLRWSTDLSTNHLIWSSGTSLSIWSTTSAHMGSVSYTHLTLPTNREV